MAARAAAGDAEFVRADAVVGGIMPEKGDGEMNVLLDFRDDEPRLRAVHDGKHRVAPVEQGAVKSGIDRVVAGEAPAADHEQNAAAVGLGRLKHVEGQGGAELAAVNDVLNPLEIRLSRLRRGGLNQEKRSEENT